MYHLTDVSLAYEINSSLFLPALVNINLTIPSGERCVIIGPSGSGKTSLLLLLAGLLSPTSGTVSFKGNTLFVPPKESALILQDYGLFPWKTVWENASLPLILQKSFSCHHNEFILSVLTELGLENCLDRFPAQLSGGQKQRVALARALVLKPQYLLMDEPFSALDELTREQLQRTLLKLWQEWKFTMVLITHNIEEAVFLGQKIVLLSPSPGQITHHLANYQDHSFSRESPHFYRQCNLIRSLLEKGESA